MKTGCFKHIEDEKNNGFISISLYPSNNDFVKHEYKSLAPNWKLFENLKSKKITEDKFIQTYNFSYYTVVKYMFTASKLRISPIRRQTPRSACRR